jgi:hypothetical protein
METPPASEFEPLFDHYLAHGCPCRFPRFRAAVARDMKEIGAPDWDVGEVPRMLAIFDRRVPLLEESQEAYSMRGSCTLCGAKVFRWGAPIFRDSFIERARITPGALPDVGAPVTGPVPVCGNIYHAAPGNVTRSERERIQSSLPRLSPELWFAYMKALAP